MSKLHRWIDLVAELLSRRAPASFEDLARGVPEYDDKLRKADALDTAKRKRAIESLKRTFERDKDELRQLGLPLRSVKDTDGVDSLYQLKHTDFYLPYLYLATSGRTAEPRRIDKYGYRGLAKLAFTADELQAVVEGAALLRSLGDPVLVASASNALRKLAVDLPLGAVKPVDDQTITMSVRARADIEVFTRLGDAVHRRKAVRFSYHTMSTDGVEQREVEPYGLFFVGGHWYLTGHDRSRSARRNFRLSRITNPRLLKASDSGDDFEVPRDFAIHDHARSRHAWELGDTEGAVAILEFLDESGPAVAARELGDSIDGDGARRSFVVRRQDAFVRWILSFAGSVVPRSPSSLVDAVGTVLREARALYDRPAVHAELSKAATMVTETDTWNASTAAGQLSRILGAIPRIADARPKLASLAADLDTDVKTLQRDLFSLGARYDLPGGFVESIRLYLDAEHVSAEANHFMRPMRLTMPELCALELGLAVLHSRRPPDERAPIATARQRLREVIMKLPDESLPGMLPEVGVATESWSARLNTVKDGIRERRKLRMRYRRSGSATPRERTIHPYSLVHANGSMYVLAWCEDERDMRTFRLDRIEALAPTEETFTRDDSIEVESLLSTHCALMNEDDYQAMRVRYSPKVARWIAEREGRELEADGSLVMDHPLADVEWGLRHVLQYGAEAEVLSPASMREAVRARISSMLGSLESQ